MEGINFAGVIMQLSVIQVSIRERKERKMTGYIRKTVPLLLAAAVMLSCICFAGTRSILVAAESEALEQTEGSSVQTEALQEAPVGNDDDNAQQERKLLDQVKKMLPIIFGMTGYDPESSKEWLLDQVKKLIKNPDQYSEDFWDSLFGTGADGISKESDTEEMGRIRFVMELPDPVRMPDTYSVAYHRLDDGGNEVITLLERDEDGNIHYVDGKTEVVYVRTDEGFRMYPVLADQDGFGEWDGVVLSARSVRSLTDHFWNCADQTFIKWLGVEHTEETEYLGRPCALYHAQPGTITFTYQCDMVIDDETGICLCYTADELLKGAVYNITDDHTIEIDIGEYDIGGDEMNFYCTAFETEDISFELPEEPS